ncbi:MAG TPA: hypothetical protein VK843_15245 [Planctomycetota bacterium]|nr:hypothetical protein [Planctomycetota bacterium]
MRTLLTGLALLLFATVAQAQIYAVSFKDDKVARKYKDHLVTINGEQVVVGEAKFSIHLDGNQIKYDGTNKNELWVSDSGDPSWVPYKVKGEERVATSPKGVLEITGSHIKNIRVLIQEQSLAGLAEEYRERLAKIQEIQGEREKATKASREWFMAHQRLISNYERLQNWLSSTCFPEAAKKLAKEIERQKKNVAADALAERLANAKASIKMVDTPSDLIECAKTATGGKLTFHVQESLHGRIVYRNEINDDRVRALLEFAEEAIDGFRGDCVDPYLDIDFEDKIPEHMFAEWFFGPQDFDEAQQMKKEYYHVAEKDHLEERKAVAGTRFNRSLPPQSVHFWRWQEAMDLEGTIAHDLGHDLTALHYNLSQTKPVNQDWLFEGVAFYISLEFLGKNTVTCKEFKETNYVHEKKKEGEREVKLGLRDFYNALALDSGPSIDKLAIRELFSFEDADVAKSWSFYDFVVKKEGKNGQRLLRAACEASADKATLLQKWRDKTNQIYSFDQGDVFKALDTRWREFAETGQETGDVARRKG